MNINQRSFSSHQQQLRPWNGFGFSHSLDMEMTDYHPTFNPNSEPGKPINSIIFKYYDVERLEQKLSVKIHSIEGDVSQFFKPLYNSESEAFSGCMYVEVRLEHKSFFGTGFNSLQDNIPLCLPKRTRFINCMDNNSMSGGSNSHHSSSSATGMNNQNNMNTGSGSAGGKVWDEWIHFKVKYNELPEETVVHFIVWDVSEPMTQTVIGSATFPLFGKKGKLKTGPFKVCLNLFEEDSTELSSHLRAGDDDLVKIEQLARCVSSEYRIEWLDRYTFQKMKRIKQRRVTNGSCNTLLLNIELPMFEHPVMNSQLLDMSSQGSQQLNNVNSLSASESRTEIDTLAESPRESPPDIFDALAGSSHFTSEQIPYESSKSKGNDQFRVEFTMRQLDWIDDGEVNQENLVEQKHLKLSIGLSSGLTDHDLKPNAEQTRKIQRILDYPPLHETSIEEKSLLWRFRYYLRSNKRALIKFLKCVDWGYIKESKEATKLIEQWAEIGTVDALALLSRFFKNVGVVRDYAVNILRNAEDEEILDVLLQLVQALRYEIDSSQGSSLMNQTGLENSNLAKFLFMRATNNFVIANNLYWYLSVESEGPKCGAMFSELLHKFSLFLKKNNLEYLEKLLRQHRLVQKLRELGKSIKQLKEIRPKKVVALKKILATREAPWDWDVIFTSSISPKFPSSPLTLPLSPTTLVTGIYEDKANIFKSAMSPLLIPFKEHTGETYHTIFKTGDDLRQDQLIIQLITLMDKLLKRNGLDLKLTPYPVLACGQSYGFVRCVSPSIAISQVIAQGDIKSYLRKYNDDDSFDQACLNFIHSCAGYCVITYILGIGDRHLDNVLLTPKGHMFHIDFGFILGRDPKPFAPPMKLCKEMVEGMGGSNSEGYITFKQLCCTAYNILRKNADLILNMFILMADASIPDIEHNANSANGQSTGKALDPLKNMMKVQEKFKPELNDAQAIIFMQSIINESEKALFPQVTETIHRWVQYWRS